jgi:alpha-L-arabinofuranosidase
VTRAINAQAFISVNYGTGTAQEAADWVRYSNITKGYGFKFWEIGNENYGSWETDAHARPHDPFSYATLSRDYINAMKAVDPDHQSWGRGHHRLRTLTRTTAIIQR